MIDELLQLVGTRKMVRVTRRTPCEPYLHGYLLDGTASLILMHSFQDFIPDGYRISRLEDAESSRSGPYEQHFDAMLRGEKLLQGLDLDVRLDLTSMRSAIESISEKYEQLIIECEDDEEDVEDFYIGSLVSATFDTIIFRHYDPSGYWDPAPSEIEIDDITIVQFDTPYINVFSKYLQGGPRPAWLQEDD